MVFTTPGYVGFRRKGFVEMGFVVHQAGWNGKRPKMGSHCLHQKFRIRSNNNTRPEEATEDTEDSSQCNCMIDLLKIE